MHNLIPGFGGGIWRGRRGMFLCSFCSFLLAKNVRTRTEEITVRQRRVRCGVREESG